SVYLRLSLNVSGSVARTLGAISTLGSGSRKWLSRARAPMMRCAPHLGQTSRVRSSSARYSTDWQLSHFIHRPSGTLFLRTPAASSFEPEIFSSQLMDQILFL